MEKDNNEKDLSETYKSKYFGNKTLFFRSLNLKCKPLPSLENNHSIF